MISTLQTEAVVDQPRVLVIESNRNYLAVFARRLAELGYRVVTAETAQAGLAELYRMPVDLALCATDRPGTSGIEFVRMIREDSVHGHLPVLLIVGRSDPAAAIRAFQAGADSVIRKPCPFEVLGACIARHIDRAAAVKRLAQDNAALDARVISRAIELREMRDRLSAIETERRRLEAVLVGRAA